jgi:hypothetical protein
MTDSEDCSISDIIVLDTFTDMFPSMSYDDSSDDVNHYMMIMMNRKLMKGGYMITTFNDIELTKEDPVDKLLNTTFKDKIHHIENIVTKLTNTGSLNKIMNEFLSPMITVVIV